MKLDQAALNGESKEAHKLIAPPDFTWGDGTIDFLDEHKLFRGSVVVEGQGIMQAVKIGDSSIYGQLTQELKDDERDSPLKLKLKGLAHHISQFGYAADGLVVIRAEEAEGMLKPMSVRRIFGIGRSAEKSLLQFGIATIGQIADADLGILRKALGNNAAVVKQLAHGLDDRPVVNDYAAKSIGKECTFEKDLHTEDERRHAVLDLCGRVGWRLRRSGVVGYTVTLKVKFASFKIITRSITAEGPVAYDEEIFALAQKLMQSVKWIEGVRLLGVSVAHLEPADAVPVLNFAEDERLGKRNQAVDILKAKFGEDIIKRGF